MSSASPERPRSLKRLSQKRTVAPHSPILAAIPGALSPSTACWMICARRTSPAPSFCERVIRASLCASSSLNPRTRSVIATSPAWTRAPCNAPDPEKSYPTCRMHYLGDGPVPDERSPIMGVYPTRDGRWAYIHSAFPNHFAAALEVLGCEGNRVAVAKVLAGWNALDFEEALIAANGAGAMVRTRAEWTAHPQAQAIAALPVMEIVRIGDSPPEPLPVGERPLAGIRVLDLTRLLAGPICGRTLAEHGAEVLKITAPHLPHMGYQEPDRGHGKLSAQLDLRAAGNAERLCELVRAAD